MKKRILSLALSVLLSFGTVVPSLAADTVDDVDMLGMVGTADLPNTADEPDTVAAPASGTCGENLTWSLDESGTLTISGTGMMNDYFGVSTPWAVNAVKKLVIEEGVTSIGRMAFVGCTNMKSASLPSTLSSINGKVFEICLSLTEITVAAENPYFTAVDGVLFSKDKTVLYAYPAGKSATSYTVPDGVTKLYDGAFERCAALTTVSLPDSLRIIGDGAFSSCEKLSSLTIPQGVTEISGSFDHCTALESIEIPASVQKLEYFAFAYCTSLIKATFYGSTTIIQENAFAGTLPGFTLYGYTGSTAEAYAEANGHTFIALDSEDNPPETLLMGKIGDNLTWYIDSAYKLTICGEGAMPDWSLDNPPWYEYRESIQTVEIEEGVTSIGEWAFYQFRAMTSVTIPQSVTTIGSSAFSTCTSLTEIMIPSGVTHIAYSAFASCHALKTVTIEDGAEELRIDEAAFQSCAALESIHLPAGLTSIGEWAFNGCNALNGVVLPQKLRSIEPFAFFNCASLTGIDIPASVTSIGGNAFYGCTALKDVKIYNKSAVLGTYIFSASPDILTISGYAGSTAETYAEQHGYPFYALSGMVIVASGTFGSLTWSLDNDGVLTISGSGAMPELASMYASPWNAYRDFVKSLVIGKGVTSIGAYVFYGHASLTDVTIGEDVASIGYQAFANCDALTEITVPAKVSSISYNAFASCDVLSAIYADAANAYYASDNGILFSKDKTVLYQYPIGKTSGLYNVPSGVTRISDYAFAHVSNLVSVSFPATLRQIGEYAFADCASLRSIGMSGYITSIGKYAFYKCSALNNTALPNALLTLGDHAFAYCTSLTSVTIPDGVTAIPDYLFYNCTSLKDVTLSANAQSIGKYAFYNCHALSSLHLPAGVAIIGENALTTCEALSEITVDAANTAFMSENGVLFNKEQTVLLQYPRMKNSTSYTVPDTVTRIGNGAFKNCTLLAKLVLPKGISTIGEYAFSGCDGLSDVVIPSGAVKISEYAFAYCDALSSVEIPATVTFVGDYAFGACPSLHTARIFTRTAEFGEDVFMYPAQSFAIHAYVGSTAETYAADHAHDFVILEASVPQVGSVLAGTAVVDGSLDAAYKGSLLCTFDGDPDTNAFKYQSPWDDASVSAYGLYDDTYVYLCAVVKDNDVVQPDASYYNKWNAYGIDGVEFRLNFADCTDTSKQFKVTVDAHGVNAFTIQPAICDISGVLYETSLTADGYIIEIAVPHGTNSDNQLLAAGELGFNMWLVDLQAEAEGAVSPEQWVDFYMYGRDLGMGNGNAVPFALTEPIEPFDIFAANMTLGNELAMNFYIPADELDGTDYYAVITKTYADGRDPVTKTVPYDEFVSFKNGSTMLWKISFNGIAAKEMADNITVQVFNSDGNAVSEVWEDSIRAYIMRNLDKTIFTAKQKVWAVECLNYGAASQTQFGYNTSDLANNRMTDAHKALGLTSVSMSNNRQLGTNAKASNLTLESGISLSMYFTGITDPSTKYAIATFTDHNGNKKEARIEGSAFKKNGSLYGVPVNMLVASDVRQLVTVTVYNVANNAVYGTCVDSVEGYAARMSNGNDVFSAVMKFGQAAYNMFH